METQIDMMVCTRCEKEFPMKQIHAVNDDPYCDGCFDYLCAMAEAQWESQQEDEFLKREEAAMDANTH